METRAHRARRDNTTLNQDIPLTRNRLAILSALGQFRYLTTELLYQFVLEATPEEARAKVDRVRVQNTLTAMRKVGGYITCHPEQFASFNSDYKQLVYSLTERGKRIVECQPFISSSSFFHDWMTSHAVASLSLEAKRDGAAFIEPLEILARVPSLEKPYRFPVEIDWRGKPEKFRLSPDFPVFGIRHGKPRFFFWETDCDTEDNAEVDDLAHASILKKVLAYNQLDTPDDRGDTAFWKRLKTSNSANYVCIVTINETRERAIKETVKRVCGKSPLFLIKQMPHFRRIDFTPQPMADLWHTGWERVGYPPFFFNNPEEE